MSVGILPIHLAPTYKLAAARLSPNTGTLAGYSVADLCDGTLGRPWRSFQSSNIHAINVSFLTIQRATFAALFDLRVYDQSVRVQSVEFGRGAWSAPTLLATGMPRRGERGGGDLGFAFEAASSSQWYLRIVLSNSSAISIGDIVIGDPLVMPRHFRAWTKDDKKTTIRNGDYATKAAQRRMRLSCDWAALTDEQHADMLSVIDPAEGALRPVVLVPDLDTPAECYHGTLSDSHPHTQGPDPHHTGHAIPFVETRRPLGW